MNSTSEFADYAVELLGGAGRVVARRMFGGYGLYCDGVMFALIADDVLYLKADEASRPDFERAHSVPFVYDAGGRRITMAYWRAPDEAMESRELATPWARRAYAAALRARSGKRHGGERNPNAQRKPPARGPARRRAK
ncbi:MAG TPA: TfoX/Sxy family protein [Burkholderiales bacterium]|nr:TfoX/Sxy family protein [Burkholderiales bacterium]